MGTVGGGCKQKRTRKQRENWTLSQGANQETHHLSAEMEKLKMKGTAYLERQKLTLRMPHCSSTPSLYNPNTFKRSFHLSVCLSVCLSVACFCVWALVLQSMCGSWRMTSWSQFSPTFNSGLNSNYSLWNCTASFSTHGTILPYPVLLQTFWKSENKNQIPLKNGLV